jgi:hypothetical protein
MNKYFLVMFFLISSCSNHEKTFVRNGTQKYIPKPGLFGSEGYRFYSPVLQLNKNKKYIWKTEIGHIGNITKKMGREWYFKVGFTKKDQGFKPNEIAAKFLSIKYVIKNQSGERFVKLDSNLQEWCASGYHNEPQYWPDYINTKRLKNEETNIKFSLDPEGCYDIEFVIDASCANDFPTDIECMIELGAGGFN